jgi:RimJ/RimL family protein N-acetyltransferase
MLRGEFVILRIPESDDINLMTGWKNDREAAKYLPYSPPVSKQDIKEYISKIEVNESSVVFIIETEDEIPIGICTLEDVDWKSSSAKITTVIYAKNCWGRGYGYDTVRTLTKYGMEQLNLHTIYVHILEGNEKAVRCFEKAGYEKEGILKHRLYKDGSYKNVVSLSIINTGIER